MILTPTYHVFEMLKVHQDAKRLDLGYNKGVYEWEGQTIQQVSASASKDASGTIYISFCNIDSHNSANLDIQL